MKNTQFILLVALTMCFVTKSFSQHRNYDIKNGFAIGGGFTQFDIITDNFETHKGNGWMAQMSATADLPHRWYNVSYGMQLSENKISVNGLASSLSTAFNPVEYKILTAQVVFLFHIKPFKTSHFTIDVGPMLQYNSDLELTNDNQENFFIADFDTVLARDIVDLNNFNVNGAVGATLGFSAFKFKAQYIYGFTNILGKLNDAEFNTIAKKDFKGNQSMLALTALITF